MTGEAINHLWQSTVFATAAGFLTIALRRNRAHVRYKVWLCASAKFLIPFALLMSLGNQWHRAPAKRAGAAPAVAAAVFEIARPFAETPAVTPIRSSRAWARLAVVCVWACGFLGIACIRFRGWLRIRAAVRASIPIGIPVAVGVRSSAGLLEPGVVGLFRPVLLVPEGIRERLSAAQLQSVLAHELCHVRRRDNLTGTIHMLVEAVFWFHPLVWWIGARLVEERERACDEAVLQLGSDPRDYADAILKVVKQYVESPLACVAGVTGSNLKKRMEEIMKNRPVFGLSLAKKAVLATAGVAAIAAPIGIGTLGLGMMSTSPMRAQSQHEPQTTPQVVAQAQSPKVLGTLQPVWNTQPWRAQLAQAQPAPVPGGRGRPASASDTLQSPAMRAAYARYGAPDQVEDRSSDAQHPSQIWRYNYLEDFHSNVEFEFSGLKGGIHVNWPPPLATFEGKPAIAEELADQLNQETQSTGGLAHAPVAGLLGEHAEMQTYPSAVSQWLVLPIVPSAGGFDVVAEIRSSDGVAVATVRDRMVLTARADGAAMGHYKAGFTLTAGAYTCNVALRDPNGQIYTEAIAFEVN